MWAARVYFLGSRFVVRRCASNSRCDVGVLQSQSVMQRLRGRDARKSVTMKRGHQEVSRSTATIAGKDAPRAIATVSGRRKSKNQHARIGIAKTGHRPGPVRVVAKRRALYTSDLGAVRPQALALVAGNDASANLTE